MQTRRKSIERWCLYCHIRHADTLQKFSVSFACDALHLLFMVIQLPNCCHELASLFFQFSVYLLMYNFVVDTRVWANQKILLRRTIGTARSACRVLHRLVCFRKCWSIASSYTLLTLCILFLTRNMDSSVSSTFVTFVNSFHFPQICDGLRNNHGRQYVASYHNMITKCFGQYNFEFPKDVTTVLNVLSHRMFWIFTTSCWLEVRRTYRTNTHRRNTNIFTFSMVCLVENIKIVPGLWPTEHSVSMGSGIQGYLQLCLIALRRVLPTKPIHTLCICRHSRIDGKIQIASAMMVLSICAILGSFGHRYLRI